MYVKASGNLLSLSAVHNLWLCPSEINQGDWNQKIAHSWCVLRSGHQIINQQPASSAYTIYSYFYCICFNLIEHNLVTHSSAVNSKLSLRCGWGVHAAHPVCLYGTLWWTCPECPHLSHSDRHSPQPAKETWLKKMDGLISSLCHFFFYFLVLKSTSMLIICVLVFLPQHSLPSCHFLHVANRAADTEVNRIVIDWFLLKCPAEAKSLQTRICPIICCRGSSCQASWWCSLPHLWWRRGCSLTHWFIVTYQVLPTHPRLTGTQWAWWWAGKRRWWNLSSWHMSTRPTVLSLIYNYRLCVKQLQGPRSFNCRHTFQLNNREIKQE